MSVQRRSLICLCLLLGLLLVSCEVGASADLPRSYNYNLWLETVPSAPACRLKREINVSTIPGVYNFGELRIHVLKNALTSSTESATVITQIMSSDHLAITLLKNEENAS